VIFLQESCTNKSFFTLILFGNRFIKAIRYGYSRHIVRRGYSVSPYIFTIQHSQPYCLEMLFILLFSFLALTDTKRTTPQASALLIT